MKAVLLGYSGLVGSCIMQEILQDNNFEQLTCLGRKKLSNTEKLKYVFTDFSNLESLEDEFQVDVVFCALGTTISKAKSKEKFYEVDFEYVLRSAKLARKKNVEKFLVVTSIGADPNSLFFYNKVKGEIERELQKLGFPFLGIFRPSLLLGNRNEFRPGEKLGEIIGKFLTPILIGKLEKYKPIEALNVAKGIVKVSKLKKIGTEIYESDIIYKLSKGEI